MFPKDDQKNLHNMRRAIAESYANLGRIEEAESEYEKIVEEYPRDPWSYIGWGDLYFFIKKEDYHRAKELYDKGLEVAKDDYDQAALEEKMVDLAE